MNLQKVVFAKKDTHKNMSSEVYSCMEKSYTRDVNYYKEELPKHGLTKGVREYYFHSISHHLGLDTHDGNDRTSALVPGNVITCEPGLYFKNLGIIKEN